MGFVITEEDGFTAVHATRNHLAQPGLKPHLLIHPDIAAEMGSSATDPDCVVLGDAADGFSFAAMNTAFRLLMQGKPLIAMARNRYFQKQEGLTLDMGADACTLEYAGPASRPAALPPCWYGKIPRTGRNRPADQARPGRG
ncbi:hypothetical protein [Candidatus Dactylopiibacterium carminicum]|uniref:hypothetical protein n=1 Tax=Candidatus Dactylopiibacterium carminicum TaxID=857335 RepID=UPI001CC323BB|nr:hypothetical protein [Candidatus Dactylopiibacterium carminicum]